MKYLLIVIFAFYHAFCGLEVLAQTWPDHHLTNGVHYSSYGVEDYDPLYAKNLYIDSKAVLQAGSTELDDIHDGNQVYLNGGTVYAAAIDAADFSWNSGMLMLNGGTHATTYGLDSGSGKTLSINTGATLHQPDLGTLPSGNKLTLYGGTLSVRDFNASMEGFLFDRKGTLEITGVLTGMPTLLEGKTVILRGSSAVWNGGSLSGGLGVEVKVYDGAKASHSGVQFESGNAHVSGKGSSWNTGGLTIGKRSNSTMTIDKGGSVSSGESVIGSNGGSKSLVEVSGEGSRWVTGSIIIGERNASRDNRLVIKDGAFVSAGGTDIGYHTGYNNSASISGSGSVWNTGGITIGLLGNDNSLDISTGAVVNSGNAAIGVWGSPYTAKNNQVYVSGKDAVWNISGSLTIGLYNRLIISSGGEVNVAKGISPSLGSVSIGGGRLAIGADFNASMGVVSFGAGSTLSVAGQLSGMPSLEAGRRLETSNILGDIAVHGTFAPGNSPAESSVHGGLTIAADGTLEMDLGGYAQNAEYDHLRVAGPSMLDGTLTILRFDSFSPTNGASFDFFDWEGGVSGQFANINTSPLVGGLEWDLSDLYTTGMLHVIPEPTSGLLMIVTGGLLYFKIRILDQRRRPAFQKLQHRQSPHACREHADDRWIAADRRSAAFDNGTRRRERRSGTGAYQPPASI